MQICFNAESQKVFDRLPIEVRTGIKIVQERIHTAVLRIYPNAVATSGFRSAAYNRSVGGVDNSYHIWGAARDYTFDSLGSDPVIPGIRVIRSRKCWHLEIE